MHVHFRSLIIFYVRDIKHVELNSIFFFIFPNIYILHHRIVRIITGCLTQINSLEKFVVVHAPEGWRTDKMEFC